MKKFLIYISIPAVVCLFGSCRYAGPEEADDGGEVRVRVAVADIHFPGLGAETRAATVAAVDGEEKVANLHLLFFEYTSGGDGLFVQDYVVGNCEAGVPVTIRIGKGEGAHLDNSKDYNILAFANLDGYIDVYGFVNSLSDRTENEVKGRLQELDGSARFTASSLPMSGAASKKAGQRSIELRLTRAVSRFDVCNPLDEYDLVSVSIYGAALRTALWGGAVPDAQTYTGRFYGLGDGVSVMPDVVGGLYTLENAIENPAQNPARTTSLVIGLRSKSDGGGTMYYRVGIHPREAAQNLLRNNVYRVTLREVLAPGGDTEDNAVAGGLDAVINNWDAGDEDLVITDGHSTIVIPAQIVRFGPDGGAFEYDLRVSGEGTLKLYTTNLPEGITADIKGNRLKISAEPLPDNDGRSGTLEIGFGSLRGTLKIVQSPQNRNLITIDPGSLPAFGHGVSETGQTVKVSAPGPWTATIYNDSEDDPAFSFAPGARAVLKWTSSGNGSFTLYATSENTTGAAKRGFIIVSLDSDPAYKQALTLEQNSK